MRISDWSSDVCSSDLLLQRGPFELHVLLAGLDQLRQFVMALLEQHVDIAPRLADGVLQIHQSVVDDDGVGQRSQHQCQPDECDQHVPPKEIPSGRGCANSGVRATIAVRSEEHTSELQSLMRISYAVFCLKKKKI